jgi:hypothetical protein
MRAALPVSAFGQHARDDALAPLCDLLSRRSPAPLCGTDVSLWFNPPVFISAFQLFSFQLFPRKIRASVPLWLGIGFFQHVSILAFQLFPPKSP